MKKGILVILSAFMLSSLLGCNMETKQTEDEKTGSVQEATQQSDITDGNGDNELGEDMESFQVTSEEKPEEPTTEEEKVSVTYDLTEEERTLDDGTVILDIACNKPTVHIKDNKDAQERIQEDIDKNETDFYINCDEMEAEARAFFTNNPVEDDAYEHFFNQLNYESARVDETVISLIRNDVSYSGGAHGYSYQNGVNYDGETGEILTLDNISDDKEALVACVKAKILEVCENGEYKDLVFPDYADYVDGVIGEDKWYFDDTGIVFIANAYELGPYSSGSLTFQVDYDSLDGLKDTYKK